MKSYTQTLEDFQLTFAEYLELEQVSFEIEVECLRDYYEENYCDWDKEHEALYWQVEQLVDEALAHFQAVEREEMLDDERDIRSYLSSEGNS